MSVPRLLLSFALVVAGLHCFGAFAQPASPAWSEPHNPKLAATRPDEYAWRLFMALNWPADQTVRQADPTKAFGSDGPVVWESWKNANDVYLEGGADPGPWLSSDASSAAAPARRFGTLTPEQQKNARHVVNGVMVPVEDAIVDSTRLREMHMNRITFDYVRANGLYSLDGQLVRYQQQRAVAFPLGAKEVKAEWRAIDPRLKFKYHTMEWRTPDGVSHLYGLTALHISSKDMPNWFWATFEHVDNPTREASEPWLRQSVDTYGCRNRKPDCNDIPRRIGLENTVWQYYRLRGTQTTFVTASGRPTLLANSELESGTGQRASCMTCHARASIGIHNGAMTRLGPFDASVPPAGERGVKRTFLGKPRQEWFYPPATSGATLPAYLPLDFVWSLSKAQWLNGSQNLQVGK